MCTRGREPQELGVAGEAEGSGHSTGDLCAVLADELNLARLRGVENVIPDRGNHVGKTTVRENK